MKLTRRVVLAGTAALAATASAVGIGWIGFRELSPRLRELASPKLPDGDPGVLSLRLQETLLAAVEALVRGSSEAATPDPSPYLRLLEHRAESIPGYRELYRRFALSADDRAVAVGHDSFAAAPPGRRREILAELCPAGRLGRLAAGIVEPDRARFRLYLAREILDLYESTTAWTALGFGSPPGAPRGLQRYTRPPGDAEVSSA